MLKLREKFISQDKLTDATFMKEQLTQLAEFKKLLNQLTESNLNEAQTNVINLLLDVSNGIFETLCNTAYDAKAIINLLPDAKDKLIETINANPTLLSKFVQNGGLPNLRPLFEVSQLVPQRELLLKTLLTNETLLILSLQRFAHLEEMIYTLTKTDRAVMPTILANHQLLRLFLNEDLNRFISMLPDYKNEILDKILKEDVLFKEKEDLNASTLQELATSFPEQLEPISQKCKEFNEVLFNEILQTSIQINTLFLPNRFDKAPLSAAVFNNEKEKIIALMQDSNNINAACHEGFTALHWACMRRNETMINDLISLGADAYVKNQYGKTPVDYYRYQIKLDDFKSTLDYSAYQRLKKEGALVAGPAEAKEFNLVFCTAPAKEMGATSRNQKPLKMDLFTVTEKPAKEQVGAIVTKTFIASPVFKKPEELKTNAGSQGYKNNTNS